MRTALVLLALAAGAAPPRGHAQTHAGGMHLPDTAQWPDMTVEVWKGLPDGVKLPGKVDLSPWFPPAGTQGRQFSCVSWALCYGVMSYRQNRADGRTYAPGDPIDSSHTFSPAYLYNLITSLGRSLHQAPDPARCKNGSDMDQMIKFTMMGGACPLKDMPYDTTLVSCCHFVSPNALMAALPHQMPPPVQVGSYAPDQWRYHLAQGRPILMGIVATTNLRDSGRVAGGERLFTWHFDPKSPALFGHAVVCTGYDNSDSTFTFLNSWGTHWGYRGYFKATLDVLEWKCSGGYVFSNDLSVDWPTTPGKPADKDTLHGPLVEEDLQPGEFQVVGQRKVGLARLGKGDDHAVLQVFDAGTDTLMSAVMMEEGRAYSLYHGDQRLQLQYDKRTWLGRLFSNTIDFTLETAPPRDEFVVQRNRQVGRLMEELETGKAVP